MEFYTSKYYFVYQEIFLTLLIQDELRFFDVSTGFHIMDYMCSNLKNLFLDILNRFVRQHIVLE